MNTAFRPVLIPQNLLDRYYAGWANVTGWGRNNTYANLQAIAPNSEYAPYTR